jgi:hypothetical protein
VNDVLVLLLVLLLVASGYTAGRVHSQIGFRDGFRSGYRQGYADGTRNRPVRLGTEVDDPTATPVELAPDDHERSERRQSRSGQRPAAHKVRHTRG